MTTQHTERNVVITTLRGPKPLADRLHAEHRRTYPEHGLSFNAWLLKLLTEGV